MRRQVSYELLSSLGVLLETLGFKDRRIVYKVQVAIRIQSVQQNVDAKALAKQSY
jgi:hypothetical protein